MPPATTSQPPVTTTKPAETTTATEALKGDVDVNGVISTSDVVKLMQALIGKVELTGESKFGADMNSDGKISILDLILLKNLLLK